MNELYTNRFLILIEYDLQTIQALAFISLYTILHFYILTDSPHHWLNNF